MAIGRLFVAACAVLMITSSASAVLIGFDTDPNGNPVSAPTLFSQANPLTTLYSPMGVTFSGPAPLDGGAILSGGGFGVNPRSAPNFLAFSRSPTAVMLNGGQPRDPATLTFATPLTSVSIYASGGGQAATFRMDAFDAGGGFLTSATGSNVSGQYVQLSIPAAPAPISRVVLTEISGDTAFLYDDLEFTLIPEPALAVALPAGILLLRRRHG